MSNKEGQAIFISAMIIKNFTRSNKNGQKAIV